MILNYDGYQWDAYAFRQRDLTPQVTYDTAYLQQRYGDIPGRVQVLANARLHLLSAILYDRLQVTQTRILDVGCGTGAFHQIARHLGYDAWGQDPVNTGLPWFVEDASLLPNVQVATYFDSLEHMVNPAASIRALNAEYVMISIPACWLPMDEDWFMQWRHRRPGEHLWHWEPSGLDKWMLLLRYRPIITGFPEDHFRPNADQRLPNIFTAIYRRES